MNTILRSKRPWRFDERTPRRLAAQAALLASLFTVALPSAHAAGQVEVRFVNPAAFADAGFGLHQREVNLRVLAEYLERRGGERLAPGQTLLVEVLDVALAGTPQPELGSGDVRLLRGGADWPRITLRYTLAGVGLPVRSGTETLTDLDYQRRFNAANASGPLRYEKRMLSEWLANRLP